MQELFSDLWFIILFATIIVQLFVFFFLFLRTGLYRKKQQDQVIFHSVSVLIAAKNEDENLRKNLPAILEQDYPDFEVIVIDDQSYDDTEFVLREMASEYPHLHIVTIEKHIKNKPGKKLAISLGVRKSSKDILLLTDADCRPASTQWIKQMVSAYTEDTDIVLGFSPYERRPSLLNLFIQFDTFYTALQYFSFTLAGMPYMGVGRNLSYKKQLFYDTGFSNQLHLPFGDDDLFVNHAANAMNTQIEISPDSFVLSEPKRKWKEWTHQKRRHLAAGKEYKIKHKFLLFCVWLSHFLFYLAFVAAIIHNPENYFYWGAYAFRLMSVMIIYSLTLRKFRQLYLLWFIPLLDVFYHALYIPLFSLRTFFSKQKNIW